MAARCAQASDQGRTEINRVFLTSNDCPTGHLRKSAAQNAHAATVIANAHAATVIVQNAHAATVIVQNAHVATVIVQNACRNPDRAERDTAFALIAAGY
jgi:hypothetical protein